MYSSIQGKANKEPVPRIVVQRTGRYSRGTTSIWQHFTVLPSTSTTYGKGLILRQNNDCHPSQPTQIKSLSVRSSPNVFRMHFPLPRSNRQLSRGKCAYLLVSGHCLYLIWLYIRNFDLSSRFCEKSHFTQNSREKFVYMSLNVFCIRQKTLFIQIIRVKWYLLFKMSFLFKKYPICLL